MRAATCEVHGTGAFSGGRDVTRIVGCHDGGDGGRGGCGGTGQPARATGAEVAGVLSEGADRCVWPLCREEARAGRRGEAAQWATRAEAAEVDAGGGADMAAIVATAATTATVSRTETVAPQCFISGEKGTIHCRGPPDDARGGALQRRCHVEPSARSHGATEPEAQAWQS